MQTILRSLITAAASCVAATAAAQDLGALQQLSPQQFESLATRATHEQRAAVIGTRTANPGVQPHAQPPAEPVATTTRYTPPASRMFGAQLFGGAFKGTLGSGFNPAYAVSIGDRLAVRMWGAFTFDGQLVVDPQGNIFIPNVGPVPVAGVANGELNQRVAAEVSRVYRSNVHVYAALDVAQPVKVFVTGFVTQPGLYGGLAADSLISFLDKAGGVDPARGSYVDIIVKRGDVVRKRVNLYDFLLKGQVDLVQLSDGDAIVVEPRQHTFVVEGEVFNAYDFEFATAELPLTTALQIARPKPGATHVSVVRRQGTERRTEYYPLAQAANVQLHDGDSIYVTADRYPGTIQVRIEGAHSGEQAMVLPYGTALATVLERIRANSMSRVDAIQLYRKSVALRQREMLEVSLQKLQEAVLSARSATSEEANLRTREADLISKFVQEARKVQPKGQVVLNEKTLATTLLEDGDVIRIPERTSVVMVHGEVLFPNALAWEQGASARDYINQVGGYTQSSDTSKVIVIRQNGEAVQASARTEVAAGDEVMVLPKVETKSIEVTRGISQIIYQIAIAAKVILDL